MKNVSVVMAAYNAEDSIEKAVRSALDNICTKELIVVNDCSSDNTRTILDSLSKCDSRIKLFNFEKNCGPSIARNTALSFASGDWVTILDADDYLLSDRIEKLLTFSGTADFIADDLILEGISATGTGRANLIGLETGARISITFENFVRSNLSSKSTERKELGYLKPLMRRSFLQEHGLKYHEKVRLGEDYLFYAKALALGARFILVPTMGYVYVGTPRSLSRDHREEDLRALCDADKEMIESMELPIAQKNLLWRHYQDVELKLYWRMFIRLVKDRQFFKSTLCLFKSFNVFMYILTNVLIEISKRAKKNFHR
jgi:succinoglycan biosynthesis protein ExoU